MDKKKYIAAGLSLIIIGLSFLIGNFIEGFDWKLLWPVFFVIPIVFLTSGYFASPDKKKNTLFAISLLIQLMIFFLIWAIGYNYLYMIKMWPFFIIITGVSFFPLFFIRKDAKLFSLSILLIIIGGIFSLFTFDFLSVTILNKIWPIFLILGGLSIIIFYFKIKK